MAVSVTVPVTGPGHCVLPCWPRNVCCRAGPRTVLQCWSRTVCYRVGSPDCVTMLVPGLCVNVLVPGLCITVLAPGLCVTVLVPGLCVTVLVHGLCVTVLVLRLCVTVRALQWSGNPYGNGYGVEMEWKWGAICENRHGLDWIWGRVST